MGVSNLIINTLNCPEVVKVIRMGTTLIIIGFGLKLITRVSDIKMQQGYVNDAVTLKLVSKIVHYIVLLTLLVGIIDGYSRIIGNVISTFGLM